MQPYFRRIGRIIEIFTFSYGFYGKRKTRFLNQKN